MSKTNNKIHAFFIILLFLLLSSCSPQKRLHRLIIKHPELTITDTIHLQDTTITPETKIDTAFPYSKLKDTVLITKEKLKLQLIEINDTIYLKAHQQSDTIIITKNIPVEKIIHQEQKEKLSNTLKFKFLVFLFGCFVVVVAFSKRN